MRRSSTKHRAVALRSVDRLSPSPASATASIGPLVDHGRQPVPHHRVIVGEHDADVRLHDRGH
jgi:hypothetical protein